MSILQRIFDARVESLSDNLDKVDDVETFKEAIDTLKQQPVTTLKILFAGVTCEATALAAKATKKPLDTSRTGISGIFF